MNGKPHGYMAGVQSGTNKSTEKGKPRKLEGWAKRAVDAERKRHRFAGTVLKRSK